MAQSMAPPAVAARGTAFGDALTQLRTRVEERLRQFEESPPTPAAVYTLEKELKAAFDEAARTILVETFHRREPAAKGQAAPRIRYHKQMYRINKRTQAEVATSFGPITLWSWLYLCTEDGEPGLHPLHVALGIGAGPATPLLAERVARVSVDHTQAEVRAWLQREHGLSWSNDRLRAALRGFRQALLPFLPALQQERVVQWRRPNGRGVVRGGYARGGGVVREDAALAARASAGSGAGSALGHAIGGSPQDDESAADDVLEGVSLPASSPPLDGLRRLSAA